MDEATKRTMFSLHRVDSHLDIHFFEIKWWWRWIDWIYWFRIKCDWRQPNPPLIIIDQIQMIDVRTCDQHILTECAMHSIHEPQADDELSEQTIECARFYQVSGAKSDQVVILQTKCWSLGYGRLQRDAFEISNCCLFVRFALRFERKRKLCARIDVLSVTNVGRRYSIERSLYISFIRFNVFTICVAAAAAVVDVVVVRRFIAMNLVHRIDTNMWTTTTTRSICDECVRMKTFHLFSTTRFFA